MRLRRFLEARRGQSSGNLAGLFIGVLISAIIGLEVFLPVFTGMVESSNMSGTTLTVMELIPMFVALLLLIALASPMMRRI